MLDKSIKPLVLIVDDTEANRTLLANIFRSKYRLQEARDGEEALRFIRKTERPDLILLDLMMPKMDGREVLRQLRLNSTTQDIPVIVITADDSTVAEYQCLEMGANDVVNKPFKVQPLLAKVRNLLERDLLKKQLIASENWNALIFAAAPNPLLVTAADGHILKANHQAESVFGYPHGALNGRHVEALIPLELRTGHDLQRMAYMSAPTSRWMADSKELLGLCLDGRRIPIRVSLNPIQVGDVVQVIVGIEDMSVLRAAQADLRLNEERLRIATEGVDDGTWDWNLDSGEIFYSAGWMAMLGYSKEEGISATLEIWENKVHPDDKALVLQAAEDYLAGRAAKLDVEFRLQHRDGHWVNILSRATLARDNKGQPLQPRRLIGIHTDITQRKVNEAIILQDQELQTVLRALLEESFQFGSLEGVLAHSLARLLAVSWLALLPKGGVFLVEPGGNSLRLVVNLGLSPQIQTLCKQLPFGCCHCGQAAATQQLRYAHCVDERHEISYEGMEDHGHYSLPLMAGNRLMGVLVLYLPTHFQREASKEEFLLSVGNILAGIIQRKQEDILRQEREELYRSVVETTTDGFVILDTQGHLLEVNEAYAKHSGFSRKELLCMNITDLEVDESGQRVEVKSYIENMIRRGSGLFETQHRSKDGHIWPLEVSASYHAMQGGRIFTFFRDISARKALNETLEQRVELRTHELESSRRQLETIIDSLPAILFIKDIEGRYLTINQRFEQEMGIAKGDILGRTDCDVFPPEIAAALASMDQPVLSSGNPLTFEERIPQKEGLCHIYLTTKLPLIDKTGKPYSLLGISIEITPIKMLQAQLSHTQSIAHLGSSHLNLADGVLTWSEETYRIFGIAHGSVVQIDHVVERIYPDDLAVTRAAWEVAKQGKPFDIEYRIQVNDRIKWVREQAEIQDEKNGLPLIIESSIQDITEFKQTQETLQYALQDAERYARIKSEFLANMSHEIRTPLNGILGLAQIGQRKSVGRASQRLFDQVYESGRLLLGIVNDILDFSKIEAGKLNIEAEDVQLERVLQHVSIMCSDRASSKGFLLRIEVDETLPAWFKGDPLRIAQILINLVGNAIKFTERGEVVLNATTEAGQMVFRVRDTGLGMSPEQVNYLFQPFEQADGSITRRFGGTGLGLAITKRLVELMAGEIEVESTLNVGSVFTVKLPLTPVSIPLTSNIIINPAIAAHDDNLLQGIRVLAAEDNPVNRMVLEDGLTLHGAKLICVENGRDALELVHKHGADNWDIVLTDVHMPVMDGHELARRLREFAPNLPVVGVTAHAMVEERDRCFASGMVAHVAKPIVLDELIGVIRHHARRQVRPEGKGESQPLGQSRGPIAQHAVETASISSVTAPEDTSTSDLAVSSDPDEALTAFIDMAALMAQFQGRRAFIDKILSTFLQSHANTPANLRAAALAGNYDDLVFLAHSFSGVAGALQANDLRLQGKEVELLARQKDQDALKKAVELALIVEKFMQTITSKQTSQ